MNKREKLNRTGESVSAGQNTMADGFGFVYVGPRNHTRRRRNKNHKGEKNKKYLTSVDRSRDAQGS